MASHEYVSYTGRYCDCSMTVGYDMYVQRESRGTRTQRVSKPGPSHESGIRARLGSSVNFRLRSSVNILSKTSTSSEEDVFIVFF